MALSVISFWHAELGARLRMIRKQKGLTLQSAAARLGCSWQLFQRYEIGTSRIYAHNLLAVSDLYKVPLKHLLPDTIPPFLRKRSAARPGHSKINPNSEATSECGEE